MCNTTPGNEAILGLCRQKRRPATYYKVLRVDADYLYKDVLCALYSQYDFKPGENIAIKSPPVRVGFKRSSNLIGFHVFLTKRDALDYMRAVAPYSIGVVARCRARLTDYIGGGHDEFRIWGPKAAVAVFSKIHVEFPQLGGQAPPRR